MIKSFPDHRNKYSPRERPIEISVSDGRVVVRDYGPGIAEEDLPRLFDRFWRGSSSRHRPGSGLGLAIVKQVADTGGGEIKVENVASGGARFELAFPAASTAEEPELKPTPVVR